MIAEDSAQTQREGTTQPLFGRDRPASGQYGLDWELMKSLGISVDGKECSFAEAFSTLREAKVREVIEKSFDETGYITQDGATVRIRGEWRQVSLLRKLVALLHLGTEPLNSVWYYYGSDWSRDGDKVHSFFVRHAQNIVDEEFLFSHDDVMILKTFEDEEPVWHSGPLFDEASELYWYKKFYTETITGQLMVLRPDQPVLYHYERERKDGG